MGGWNEEIFYSYYQLGNIFVKISPTSLEFILKYYLLAFNASKNRIESLIALSNYLSNMGYQSLSDTIIKPIIDTIKQAPIGLFVENNKYEQ
jgi:hypothetical protein